MTLSFREVFHWAWRGAVHSEGWDGAACSWAVVVLSTLGRCYRAVCRQGWLTSGFGKLRGIAIDWVTERSGPSRGMKPNSSWGTSLHTHGAMMVVCDPVSQGGAGRGHNHA